MAAQHNAPDAATGLFGDFVNAIRRNDRRLALKILEAALGSLSPAEHAALLRLVIFDPRSNLLELTHAGNLWRRIESPSLKPNPVSRRVTIISDTTVGGLVPLLKLFGAAFGLVLDIEIGAYDSVESNLLDPNSALHQSPPDLLLLVLSDFWLQRYLGSGALIARNSIIGAVDTVLGFLNEIRGKTSCDVLVAPVCRRLAPLPGGYISTPEKLGRDLAVAEFLAGVIGGLGPNAHLIELGGPVEAAGGAAALGGISYQRARVAFEPGGLVAAAREITSAVANLYGKSHRALVTDFDNTLWGGEVAELGIGQVVCGQDSPEGLGYYLLQDYIKALTPLGVLLAGISRNDPAIVDALALNPDFALHPRDFAAIEVGFGPKGDALAQVAADLGFGSEFMVFMDDSVFEVVQVMTHHPHVDIVIATPDDPLATLLALSRARFFNAIVHSNADAGRTQHAQSLRAQRTAQRKFESIDGFLRSIDIRLRVAPLGPENGGRIEQLLQKSNQFNLTTRRHRLADLIRMQDTGAQVLGFSYEDSFGPQGLIAVAVLVPSPDAVEVESLVMSCRVLNRTVENAIVAHVRALFPGRAVSATYIPTEKNVLVRDLYRKLGFAAAGAEDNGTTRWRLAPDSGKIAGLEHFASIQAEENDGS